MTSIRHLCQNQAPKLSSMRNPPSDSLGILTALTAGIWDQRCNTTGVTTCSSTRQNPNKSPIPSNYFPRKYQCHMQLQLLWPSKPLQKLSAFSSSRNLSRSPKRAPIKSTPSNNSPPSSKNISTTKRPLPSHLRGFPTTLPRHHLRGCQKILFLPTAPRPRQQSRQLFSEGGYAHSTSLPHSSYYGAPATSQQRHHSTLSLGQRHH